jgi:two-component system CheB/CheR fusion protein
VVGVGASAGGLDAFKKLFSAMPVDSGMAFALVPHLDPRHESLMVESLDKHTGIPVLEAQDGMPVLPNHVYVIPPGTDLTITDRVLHVAPLTQRRGAETAIDGFLRSLAADQQRLAVGIILSGTGSHGTAGLTAVKAAGGLALAQMPESAEHDQMPRSAVAAGVVDHVLPPDQMPAALVRHAAHLSTRTADSSLEELGQILALLRAEAKRDFRGYRTNMLLRRVKRRMGLCRIDQVAGYITYLHTHPAEVRALAKDLSIGVTAFFREPDAFRVLERVVIPELIERGGQPDNGGRPVRVWVPGCATGEEAYSIAILFFEQFALAGQPIVLQIFATDVDDESLDVARTGLYPETIAADVSAERLRRFFVPTQDQRYQVSQPLRAAITFAPQNLTADAPFSKLDLIACRNVLIYLEPDVQAKLMALFDFALLDSGYLMLGPAESIGQATNRFIPISKKWRVFRRGGAAHRDIPEIPILPAGKPRAGVLHTADRPRPAAAVTDLLQRALIADFAPAAVLVNPRYEILSVLGPIVDFLEFPPGALTRDLLAMARPGLRTAIRSACQQALEDHHAVTDAHARVKRQHTYVACTVTARPVATRNDPQTLLLVTFQDSPGHRAAGTTKKVATATDRSIDESRRVRQLEDDLKDMRDEQRNTIDELRTANEELKASHEEAMSINEELQSTNEELETSKEELQLLNEELSTVNSQLQDKVRELDTANNDMMNLLASTEIATVFLDTDLRIKRFTPATARLLNLLATDLGRPFRDIAPRVPDAALLEDCRRVIEQLAPLETVVRADDTTAYLRRVLPYRTADRRIDGVVITWVDITGRLVADAAARQLSTVLQDSSDAITLLDLEGRIIGWNRGAERLYGWTEAEALTMRVEDLVPRAQLAVTGDRIRRMANGEVATESVATLRKTKEGQTRDVWLTLTLLRDATGQPDAIVTTERDVTELKEGLVAKQVAQLYHQVIERLPAGAVLREDGRLTMNRAAEAITGYSRDELPTVDAWCAALHCDQECDCRPLYETSHASEGEAEPVTLAMRGKDKQTRHVELAKSRLDETHELWMLLDMTERDRAERALRWSEDHLRSIVNTAADAIVTIDEQGAIETFNTAAEYMFGYAAAEVVGRNVNLLMPPPYRDEHAGFIARYRETGEAHVIGTGREVVGLRKDGTTFPLHVAVSQIDHLGGFTGILRDLSDRQQLEWRLAEAQGEERRRLARELHDGLGGDLTGIGLLAQTLRTRLANAGSTLAAKAAELVTCIEDAQKQLRAAARELMPVDTIPEGLMEALNTLVKQCETTSGIPCRFQCEPPIHFEDPGTALHLFRIAQEAVHNARRHSQAAEISVTLQRVGDSLEIVVTDDGTGLKQVPGNHSGIGMDSMRQRARLLGGDCSVLPREGGGTVVRCRVPLPDRRTRHTETSAAPRRRGLAG